jgi:hypothetical protein
MRSHAAVGRLRDRLRTMEDSPLARRIDTRVGQHLLLSERLVARHSPLAVL